MKQEDAPYESRYMEAAVALARKSRPSPNPRVGAVLVKDGTIVGAGFHEKPGTPHAEVNAIADAGVHAEGADLYVTLEPCVHFGRTGPCVKAIESACIRRVFVGMTDPDIRVNGQGIAYLRNAGIEVETGVDESHCRQLLEGYITHRTKGRPHIILKAAITLDGYVATTTHDSKWISSSDSRKLAHALRAEADAVLVGIGTVLHDDPMLTVRDADGPCPLRIVLDSSLAIPLESKLIRTAEKCPLLLVHNNIASEERRQQLQKIPGVSILNCKQTPSGHIDLSDLATRLAENGVLSLLVEGGSQIMSAFLETPLVDQLVLFIAPKIIGSGIPFTTYPHAEVISEGLDLTVIETKRIGDDIFYRATIKNPS